MTGPTTPCALCGLLVTPTLRQVRFWRTAINRNQNLLGKLIIVLTRHEEAVASLSVEEWGELRTEIHWATGRLRAAFAPDHFNYAFLQNQDRHVHLHVIPRYASARRVAGVDLDDPDYPGHYGVPGSERIASEATLAAIADALSSS